MINSRAKGIRFELDTRNFFRRWFPKAERSYGQSRRGSDAPDVSGTPFWIECKHKKKIYPSEIIKWLEKSHDEALEDQLIIIRHKQNYTPVKYAMLSFDLNNLEISAKYWGERPSDVRSCYKVFYVINIPEQYISDLLDFAYGVAESEESEEKDED